MQYYALSGLGEFDSGTRGDALRACPWLSYCAPLALSFLTFEASHQTTDGGKTWSRVNSEIRFHDMKFIGLGRAFLVSDKDTYNSYVSRQP